MNIVTCKNRIIRLQNYFQTSLTPHHFRRSTTSGRRRQSISKKANQNRLSGDHRGHRRHRLRPSGRNPRRPSLYLPTTSRMLFEETTSGKRGPRRSMLTNSIRFCLYGRTQVDSKKESKSRREAKGAKREAAKRADGGSASKGTGARTRANPTNAVASKCFGSRNAKNAGGYATCANESKFLEFSGRIFCLWCKF